MPWLAFSRHLTVICRVFWKTLGYNFLGQTFKVTAATLNICHVVFEGECLHLNYDSLCGFQSLPKPYKYIWTVLSWKPLASSKGSPVTPECDHSHFYQKTLTTVINRMVREKGFSLQKNLSALLLFGWKKERAALHFPLTSFHRGIKRFSLSHLKKRNGAGRAREGWWMTQC